MTGIPVRILGGGEAKITQIGQMITAPFSYDEAVAKTLTVDDTPINFFVPVVGKQFVVTSILLTSDSNVQASAIIDVYEATSLTDSVIAKSILHIDLLKNDHRDFIGLNLLVTAGRYLNIKADDSDVSATIMGYYIPKIN